MKTRLEYIKEIMGPRYMPNTLKVELSLHEANMIHRCLIKAHQQAQRSSDALFQAMNEARQTAIETYGALAGFEAELSFFQEKHQLTEMQKFKLVTIDQNDGEEHA